MEYYLRFEGVNLDSVLSDTDQLSVIRGTGLLLLDAGEAVAARPIGADDSEPPDGGDDDVAAQTAPAENAFPRANELTRISVGASAALYRFDARDEAEAVQMRADLAAWLCQWYEDLTFVVDVEPLARDNATPSFETVQQRLTTRNRLRQMQQLTVAVPASDPSGTLACGFDGVRPATGTLTIGGEARRASASVQRRFRYGRDMRQRFFQKTLDKDLPAGITFTSNLQVLADSTAFDTLNNKVAVLHFDGNQFGSIKAQHCTTPEALIAFDEVVQGRHRAFLKRLLDRAQSDPGFRTAKGELRMEVLLWGGDEFALVVPAWRGLWTLQQFYKTVSGTTFSPPTSAGGSNKKKNKKGGNRNAGVPLTYAGGIVFSQAKAPIARLRKAAAELVDAAKDDAPGANAFDYLVLESLDYPTEQLSEMNARRYVDQADVRRCLPPPSEAEWRKLQAWSDEAVLGKSAIASLAHAAVEKPDPDEFLRWRERYEELVRRRGGDDAVDVLERFFGPPTMRSLEAMIRKHKMGGAHTSVERWPWLHVADLWDYIIAPRGGEARYV